MLLLKVSLSCIPMGIYYCILFAIFYPKTLSHPLKNLSVLLFSSLLAPCGIFDSFLLSESIWGATHFTGLSFRQCLNHARARRTLHPSGTAWKLKQGLSMQWPIVRKHQLDSHARFIDDTLDPSCSLPSIFFDGKYTSHARRKQR